MALLADQAIQLIPDAIIARGPTSRLGGCFGLRGGYVGWRGELDFRLPQPRCRSRRPGRPHAPRVQPRSTSGRGIAMRFCRLIAVLVTDIRLLCEREEGRLQALLTYNFPTIHPRYWRYHTTAI